MVDCLLSIKIFDIFYWLVQIKLVECACIYPKTFTILCDYDGNECQCVIIIFQILGHMLPLIILMWIFVEMLFFFLGNEEFVLNPKWFY